MIYDLIKDSVSLDLVETAREGIGYNEFDYFIRKYPLSLISWSYILNISVKTLKKYKGENKRFSTQRSEKILLLMILFKKGTAVFGNREIFISWTKTKNDALGSNKPVELLDTIFGINLITDELGKIEYGILS